MTFPLDNPTADEQVEYIGTFMAVLADILRGMIDEAVTDFLSSHTEEKVQTENEKINFYKTSNAAVSIKEIFCNHCHGTFYELEDHELEYC